MLAAGGREANFEGVRRDSLVAAVSVVAAWTLVTPLPAAAQTAAEQAKLPGVVVTATRTEQSPFDVPASIDRIGSDTIRDAKPQVNISESLGGVPGLLARDRQNYAQDVQISVRGFGARSTFGIRGVRLYVDGIPATLPDGQGQITNVDLGTADRIEVLRGPFSALYGNSSGGVIQAFSEEGSGPPAVGAGAFVGSYGARRLGVKASGGNGGFGYVVGGSAFGTDGYRDHSEAERYIGNAKLNWRDGNDLLTLVVNHVDLRAQDPLGLTRAQFESDPSSVDPAATQFNTRKTVGQTQLGAIWERRIDDVNSLRALLYFGTRSTTQFQAIPVAPQANPLHPGGVIDLDRDYDGVDVRWTARMRLAGAPFTVIAGIAYDELDEHRLGFQNFIGPVLGVQGALRRDENNTVANSDQYAQAAWELGRWTLNAGVRNSSVRFNSKDHYVVGANPDDSGSVRYDATLPVAGVMFKASDAIRLYATAGRGFETPTLNELAYRPNGQTGLNFGLQAAKSNSIEVGVKTRSAWGDANLAIFETHTDNEIATFSNVGGRSTYQNVGSTRRRGAEASWSGELRTDVRAHLAATYLDARYRDTFTTCTTTPCAPPPTPPCAPGPPAPAPTACPVTVPAGNRMPGLAQNAFYSALTWAPPLGWRAGVEFRALSKVYVNDVNSDAAAGFGTVSANVGWLAKAGRIDWSAFARVDNLFDRHYAGSVIVNEGNSRYFEPAPGRNWSIGIAASASY